MEINIKNNFNGIIFSYNCEKNNIILTIKEALKNNINLSGADLRYANLSGADLSYADLIGVNLSYADLIGANLSGVNLRRTNLSYADLIGANLDGANLDGANLARADLRRADLRRANLSGANLNGANLDGAILDGTEIPMYCKWAVTIINNEIIRIGCKEKSLLEWVEWFENSDEVYQTKRDSIEFKRIRASFYAHKTYIENM
jgi:uncharacterized protein YjbI with pentapeptide repeats